jgi:hypothetical protein
MKKNAASDAFDYNEMNEEAFSAALQGRDEEGKIEE